MNDLLKSKTVARIFRNKEKEVVIEFEDGTRMFVDSKDKLEVSVT